MISSEFGVYTQVSLIQALNELHSGRFVIPTIQRDFVWPRTKIASLFDSLVRGYPVGTFLLWKLDQRLVKDHQFYSVKPDVIQGKSPGLVEPKHEQPLAILDGQQRLTALYVGLHGSHATSAKPSSPLELCVNLYAEPWAKHLSYGSEFAFRKPSERSTGANYWLPLRRVSDYLLKDPNVPEPSIAELELPRHRQGPAEALLERLSEALAHERSFTYHEVRAKHLEEVQQVFERVNSSGKRLTGNDLILSRAAALTPGGADLRRRIDRLGEEIAKRLGQDRVPRRIITDGSVYAFSQLVVGSPPATLETSHEKTDWLLQEIYRKWDSIEHAIIEACRLLDMIGVLRLVEGNALIPVAVWVWLLGNKDGSTVQFDLQHERFRDGRENVVQWIVSSQLLADAFWTGKTSRELKRMFDIMVAAHDSKPDRFPIDELSAEFLSPYLIDLDSTLDEILQVQKSDRDRALPLLRLLFPPSTPLAGERDIDHVFPESWFTEQRLKSSGFADVEIELLMTQCQELPNLDLLPSQFNRTDKSDQSPVQFYSGDAFPYSERREHFVDDLPEPCSPETFGQFFQTRANTIRSRLKELLGAHVHVLDQDA